MLFCRKHFHDRIIWLRKSRLTPPLFIEVPVPDQEDERSCICLLGVNLSTIFLPWIKLGSFPNITAPFTMASTASWGQITPIFGNALFIRSYKTGDWENPPTIKIVPILFPRNVSQENNIFKWSIISSTIVFVRISQIVVFFIWPVFFRCQIPTPEDSRCSRKHQQRRFIQMY